MRSNYSPHIHVRRMRFCASVCSVNDRGQRLGRLGPQVSHKRARGERAAVFHLLFADACMLLHNLRALDNVALEECPRNTRFEHWDSENVFLIWMLQFDVHLIIACLYWVSSVFLWGNNIMFVVVNHLGFAPHARGLRFESNQCHRTQSCVQCFTCNACRYSGITVFMYSDHHDSTIGVNCGESADFHTSKVDRRWGFANLSYTVKVFTLQ